MNSMMTDSKPMLPTLFQIAAHWENFAPASTMKTSPVLGQIPFADLMLNPQKLVIALKAAKAEKNALAATVISRALSRKKTSGRATRVETQETCPSTQTTTTRALPQLRNVQFYLNAPDAQSVQVAGDFTSWEQFPLDMMRSEDGTWFTFVPLAPGLYNYRFIVDGQWCDDPNSMEKMENPFGTSNAVKWVE